MLKAIFKIFYQFPKITGFLGFLLTFLVTQFLTLKDYQLILSQEEIETREMLNSIEKNISSGLNYAFAATRTLAFLEENYGTLDNFEEIGSAIIKNQPYLDAIQLLEQGEIVAVYPLEKNEKALGLDILQSPHLRTEALIALDKSNIYFAGPLELTQGGQAIVGRYPIYKDDEFWGFSACIIRMETFEEMIGLTQELTGRFYFQFSKINPNTLREEFFLPETDEDFSGRKESLVLDIGDWKLSVQLKESKAFKSVYFLGVLRLVFAFILGFVSWYLAFLPSLLRKKINRQTRKLKKSNERFYYASQATSEAIWDWNLSTGYVYRTENFEKLFGHPRNKYTDNNLFWNEMIHPDDRALVLSRVKALIHSDKNHWEHQFRFKKSDGTYAYVLDKVVVIRDKNGKAIRVIGASQDVTEAVEAQQNLEKMGQELEKRARDLELSNAELEQFAFKASQDLQEPLRMIRSFLKLIERKYEAVLDANGKQYIHYAIDGSERLKKIILDLLEYSKAENIGLKEHFSLNETIEEVKFLLKAQIQETNAIILFDPLPVIHASKIAMRQLFQNLISNAIKYRSENKTPVINLDWHENEEYWFFKITDNGIGIPKKFQDKVFLVFERLHPQEKYSGTGLGLSICKKIVENHDGSISMTSEPGQGTIFYFSIKKKMTSL
ncbi:MAG: ATP-binding protein [Cecembia sp.]